MRLPNYHEEISPAATLPISEISLPVFARSFAMRAPRLHLFLGGGASVSSGVPSAADLVWDFKRRVYASETNQQVERVGPIADPTVQQSLQKYFDAKEGFPGTGADNEYSYYFDRSYPQGRDRRLYINSLLDGKKPGYGYHCLATLLLRNKIRTVWTSNFDDLPERAFGALAEGRAASVVGRDTPGRYEVFDRDERYPIFVKLHGDYKYDALKNAGSEIAQLDSELRSAMINSSSSYGLVIVGYSGRDESVMTALTDAFRHFGAKAFPDGFFWCLREDEEPRQPVVKLSEFAVAIGAPFEYVRISDFDDFSAALYKATGVSHPLVENQLAERHFSRAGYTLLRQGKSEPALKFNAIPIVEYPSTCYRFKSEVLGWAHLREITRGKEIAAALDRHAVICLGISSAIETAFAKEGVEEFKPMSVELTDLRQSDSHVIGLFYEAIAACLCHDGVLTAAGSRRRILYFGDNVKIPEQTARTFGTLNLKTGNALIRDSKKGYWIHEAVEISLDYREDKLWLLIRPTVVLTTDAGKELYKGLEKTALIREAIATRYNPSVSDLLTFWLNVVWERTKSGRMTYPPSAEIGFHFQAARTLGFSYKQT